MVRRAVTEMSLASAPRCSSSALGPLLPFDVCFRIRDQERAKARAGSRPRLDAAVCACGADFPVLLGLVARRITRCARVAQTDAASQQWRRAARAATSPAVLGAAYARGRPPARSFAAPEVAFGAGGTVGDCRARGRPPGAISGSASSAGTGEARAQRALPGLTRGVCLSGANADRAASYAARARAEQRSEVVAQRRPTQHEPLAGASWRGALGSQGKGGRASTSAMGRMQTSACPRSRRAMQRVVCWQ